MVDAASFGAVCAVEGREGGGGGGVKRGGDVARSSQLKICFFDIRNFLKKCTRCKPFNA